VTALWTIHQPHYYLTLLNVLVNASVTESDATHVTYASSTGSVVFEGTFTGSPASDGTVTSFRLVEAGELVLEVEDCALAYDALAATIANILQEPRDFESLILSDAAQVVGSGFDDEMFGGESNDVLSGRAGDDMLYCDAGKDVAKGGSGGDGLFGEDGMDVLKGNGGDDLLSGGAGRDTLFGGGGDDRFAFGPEFGGGDVDTIADFRPGKDAIELYLEGLVSSEPLAAGRFRVGAEAKDGNDLVIYDRKTGDLFIDLDGKGGAEQVKFAKVEPRTELSHGDFGLFPLG
jgi:Ca2+-binding RTX toxin-like protein